MYSNSKDRVTLDSFQIFNFVWHNHESPPFCPSPRSSFNTRIGSELTASIFSQNICMHSSATNQHKKGPVDQALHGTNAVLMQCTVKSSSTALAPVPKHWVYYNRCSAYIRWHTNHFLWSREYRAGLSTVEPATSWSSLGWVWGPWPYNARAHRGLEVGREVTSWRD